jgi:diguanylate cyclase (GGDEF)-like protein
MEVITSSAGTNNPYTVGGQEPLNKYLYCEKVIRSQQPLHIPDALNDKEWDKNPDINLGMIAYYGVPINWPDGSPFGTFCVLNSRVCSLLPDKKSLIREFAKVIETLLHQAVTVEELRHLAQYDNLTQVYTRGAVLDRLKHEFDRFKRYQTDLSIIFFDIDHFKVINDTYGHACGDHLLTTFARTIKGKLRQTDFIGRLGGDEFLICMSDTDLDNACQQAERTRQLVEDLILEIDGKNLSINVSCGVAQALETDANIEKIVARADDALYQAKEQGRNRVAVSRD